MWSSCAWIGTSDDSVTAPSRTVAGLGCGKRATRPGVPTPRRQYSTELEVAILPKPVSRRVRCISGHTALLWFRCVPAFVEREDTAYTDTGSCTGRGKRGHSHHCHRRIKTTSSGSGGAVCVWRRLGVRACRTAPPRLDRPGLRERCCFQLFRHRTRY